MTAVLAVGSANGRSENALVMIAIVEVYSVPFSLQNCRDFNPFILISLFQKVSFVVQLSSN